MKSQYLPSVCQTHEAYYSGEIQLGNGKVLLKKTEIGTLRKMCDLISNCSLESFKVLDGYHVGFSISRIANEFDLLRFGTDYNVNIELKSRVDSERKFDIMGAQMKKQYYYLNFLEKPVKLYTYVENEGFYHYNVEKDCVEGVNLYTVVRTLADQIVDFESDPEKLFIPSRYFVSPFNDVERFLADEYFLTPDQSKKKKEILEAIENKECLFVCVSADAGTGKTLLTYDIAKTYRRAGKSALIIHCAALNDGQNELINKYNWSITPASVLKWPDLNSIIKDPDVIIVDEAQRMWKNQLGTLLSYVYEKKIPMIFSYDPKQYLKDGEDRNVYSYLMGKYPNDTAELKKLTTRIRTNRKIASFINNMLEPGSSKDNLDYENITIEYFNNAKDAQEYLICLDSLRGWTAITFTSSQRSQEPIDSLSCLCDRKAHGVIGQEFGKVVFAMDSNFKYSENNKLAVKKNYYSPKGMLYQILTRAVTDLKIIVINNPALYEKLMSIKHMGDQENN